MKNIRVRPVLLLVLVVLAVVALGACKETKAPVTTPVPPPPSSRPPDQLDMKIEAAVVATARLLDLAHSPVDASQPDDTVQFSAKAVVPPGGRIAVEVVGTDWKIPLSTSAGGENAYAASSTVPTIAPGSYKLRGHVFTADGQDAAQLVADAPLLIRPKISPCVAMQNDLATLRVHFEYDKAILTPADKTLIGSIADKLKSTTGTTLGVTIEGHCDQRGTVKYNEALGALRANVVKTYLASLGVAPARIKTASFGKERPLNPAENETAYAENRRAEFKLDCTGG